MSYTVELDVYCGPLDLLLHLVGRDELTIEGIPVARVADQFVAYLEGLSIIDIEIAGDFLVMAARLTEMKSRALLPTPTSEDEGLDPELLAEESDLIQRLLEYRVYKEASRWLRRRKDRRALLYSRRIVSPFEEEEEEKEDEEEETLLPDGVTIYDIFSSFLRISKEILLEDLKPVVYDDVPIEDHILHIVEHIRKKGLSAFSHVVPPTAGKLYLIGAFLALLELIRQNRVNAEQEEDFGDIRIEVKPEPDAPGEGNGPEAPPPHPPPETGKSPEGPR